MGRAGIILAFTSKSGGERHCKDPLKRCGMASRSRQARSLKNSVCRLFRPPHLQALLRRVFSPDLQAFSQGSGWPRAMPCHVMASRAMPGHIFVCHAICLRVMPCHEYSMPCRVRIFLEKYFRKNIFRNLVPEFSWVQNMFRNLVRNICLSSAKSICLFSVCH